MDDKPQRVVGEDGELLVPLHPDKRKRQPNRFYLALILLVVVCLMFFVSPLVLLMLPDDVTIGDDFPTVLMQRNRVIEAYVIQTAAAQGRYPVYELDVISTTTSGPTNIIAEQWFYPLSERNLAWGQPAFASSYDGENYPVNVTHSTVGVWRSVGSTGTWFYVDLGEAQTFNQIITTLYVDRDFSDAPRTDYMISDDLVTWRVVYSETHTQSDSTRGHPRTLNLDAPVTARYVGLYAAAWDGGWGELSQFAVLLAETDAP
jgi:hypothetical protein